MSFLEQRIDGPDPSRATGRVAEVFDEVVRQFGRVSNFGRVMAMAPGALEAWMTANRGVRMRYLTEDPAFLRVEQAVIIRTSSTNRSQYCLFHNLELGAEAGLSEEQIRDIQSPNFESSPSLTAPVKVAVAWADAVTTLRAGTDDRLFARMQECFTDQQIVELTVLCGMWNFSNRFTDALRIKLEPEGQRLRFHHEPSKLAT